MARPTLSVYWEGTANSLEPATTQIGLFAAATDAFDVTSKAIPRETTQLKMAFDGCGRTHGTLGLLFAAGLRSQAALVAAKLREMREVYNQKPIRCNVVGLSRGGLACVYLAQALGDVPRKDVELHMLLFDPVPGDQTWSGFPFTGAFGKDMSKCKCLRKVLSLYPYEPLPDIAFHAPVLCNYPSDAVVEEDVTLGCHQGALWVTMRGSRNELHQASNLAFRRIVNFLTDHETPLRDLQTFFGYQPTDADCLDICRNALKRDRPSIRKLHDGCGLGRTIVRRSQAQFLNKYHEHLERQFGGHLLRDPPHSRRGFSEEGNNNSNIRIEDDPRILPTYMLDIDLPPPDRHHTCFWTASSSSS